MDQETEVRVMKLYKELRSSRAVAVELKMAPMTVQQIVRRNSGQCIKCGSTRLQFGAKQCAKCQKAERERIKERREQQRRLGLCQECDRPCDPPSRTLCSEHRLAAIERNQRYNERRNPEGSPHAAYRSLQQKLYNIREKYGQAGVDCYLAANGKCSICPSVYPEHSIHIHHIDCDEQNHDPANMTCLCYRCHTATHTLLRLRNREGFLLWFCATYPEMGSITSAASDLGATSHRDTTSHDVVAAPRPRVAVKSRKSRAGGRAATR